MSTNRRIRALLADDHGIMRDGLALLFESQPDIELVDRVEVGEATVQLARKLRPDVIVIGFSMAAKDCVALCRSIMTENPDIRIVALLAYLHVHILEQATKAGVSGFVLMECGFDELNRAVRAVCENETYMCPKTKDILVNSYWNQMHNGKKAESSSLTDREYEVIRLLSLGMTAKEIALRLGVSPKTVDADRRSIMCKLQINSIAELVKYAIRVGISSA